MCDNKNGPLSLMSGQHAKNIYEWVTIWNNKLYIFTLLSWLIIFLSVLYCLAKITQEHKLLMTVENHIKPTNTM